MKKLFIYLSVVMFAMAAASCQKELGVAEGGNGNATFAIHTPDVNTRAIADGENVNIVYYEVYKAENNHKNSINGGEPLIDGVITDFTSGKTLSLNLLQDQSYVALFWAQVSGNNYYDVTDLREVKVNYNGANANDEARAAFCQKLAFSTSKSYSGKVELVRPFAQINLGTTLSSIDKNVIGYDLELKQSYMEVVGVGTSFNVASMTTGNGSTTAKFANYTVPHAFDPKEVLKVDDVIYAYVGMNYILVPGDASNVDIQYKVITDIGTVTREVISVPVKKNHRTNLLGNLLTQETNIEIVVDKNFITPDENISFTTTTEQIASAAAGSTIWVSDNTVVALPETIADNVTINGGKNTVLTCPSVVKANNLTVKNVEFKQLVNEKKYAALRLKGYGYFEDCTFSGMNGLYQGYSDEGSLDGACTFKNCKFDASWAYAFNTSGVGPVVLDGCEIIGWTSFGHKGETTIKDCVFDDNGTYGQLRLYRKSTVTNCTFKDGMSIDFQNPSQGTLEGVELTFTNCKKEDGSSIVSLIEMNCFEKAKPVLTVDGVQYVGAYETIELNNNTVAIANYDLAQTLNVKGNGTLVVENVKLSGIVTEGDGVKLSGKNLVVEATDGSAISGSVTIENFTGLTAKGAGNHAYGIGGDNATVVIKNSTIDYACGGHIQPLFVNDPKYGKSEPEGAPAIGGANITIEGSVITKVDGGSKAAAIGAKFWTNTDVAIKNSTIVEANGGNASAGIGGSRYASSISAENKQICKVYIENSNVTATGGQGGAGIGSGYDTHCTANDSNSINDIVIVNSTVNAQGGKYAAGIGTGFHAAALTGSIDALSVVNAVSGENFYKAEYTTAQNIGYGVVDATREFKDCVVTFTVAGNVVANPAQ